MSLNSKKSIAGSAMLVLLGMLALLGGDSWLFVLVPAAVLVWYSVGPALRSGRN